MYYVEAGDKVYANGHHTSQQQQLFPLENQTKYKVGKTADSV